MRLVALGASNLTRGQPTLVSLARSRWGPDVEVVGALGVGRSYGLVSRVLVRSLPSILDAGLWPALDRLPPAPTRAIVADVGNDILYGALPARILGWVAECVGRLEAHTREIVLTGLPLHSLRRQPGWKLLTLRTVLFPRCRLSRAEILARAEEVATGLEDLAARRGVRFVPLRPDWYGFDPIHIRVGMWRAAWGEIVCGSDEGGERGAPMGLVEAVRLLSLWPERQWLCGLAQRTPQPGRRLPGGGRVWLY